MHQCVVLFCSYFQCGLLPLLTPPSSDPNINAILVANTAVIIAATANRFYCGRCYCHSHHRCVGVHSNYLLLLKLHLPTTLLTLLQSLPCGAPSLLLAAITNVVTKNESTELHIFPSFCFGNDGSKFDGKCNRNDDGNGSGDDLSSSVL